MQLAWPPPLFYWTFACICAVISFIVFPSMTRTSPQRAVDTKQMRSAFQASRLTPSTFLIKEYDDIYSEHPHIYAKIVPSANTMLIVDTGCGGASNDSEIQITNLRQFIETINVHDNDEKPLNDKGRMQYIVVTTHCHYDHILGVEHFHDSPILASSHYPGFLAPSSLPESSLCNAYNIRTPLYTPTLVPHLHPIESHNHAHIPLGVTILHTPGHTPDELALYDSAEGMLYVGDSLYEDEHIIFPKEGSITAWISSIGYLISFVKAEEQRFLEEKDIGGVARKVLINSGHRTVLRPALDVLEAGNAFMHDIVKGMEPIKKRWKKRGEETVEYKQGGGRFSLICPERLVLEAQKI